MNVVKEPMSVRIDLRRRRLGVLVRSAWYKIRGRCGETEYVYGACNMPRGHHVDVDGICTAPIYGYSSNHLELRHRRVWANWSGR